MVGALSVIDQTELCDMGNAKALEYRVYINSKNLYSDRDHLSLGFLISTAMR